MLVKKSYPILYSSRNIFYYSNYFGYRSKERKNFIKENNYVNLVQNHHIIPKQFKNHELLEKINFNINDSCNILIMPNKNGVKKLNIDPKTTIHDGSHGKYNKFIKKELDDIYKKDYVDTQKYYFWLLVTYLKDNLHLNKDKFPWN